MNITTATDGVHSCPKW